MMNFKLSRTLAAGFTAAMVLLAAAGNVFPATLYVDVNSTNLTASPAFVTLATGIEGQAGATTFVDSNARGAGPFFYRVGVSTP